MKKCILRFLSFAMSLVGFQSATFAVTIEECVSSATENYPLISRYGLLESVSEIELSDINKSWLPRLGLYGQTTLQNSVPSLPEALLNVLKQIDKEPKGLCRFQYKIGLDISQNVWDGGAAGARRDLVRRREAVEKASLDVELYAVRERVENLYFAILLAEEQIAQCRITHGVLQANLERLRSMLKNGTAMQSDLDMVEAQALTINQSIIQATDLVRGLREALSVFTGRDLMSEILKWPEGEAPEVLEPKRPELSLFERRKELNCANRQMAETSLYPRIGFFAQSFYGYPGFDYFKGMMSRDLSFNVLAGVKITWNIDGFYTRKNTRSREAFNNLQVEIATDIFTFNNRIQTLTETSKIEGLKSVIEDDARIVELRKKVRKAAESRLENGVIDATDLLVKIADESNAILTSRLHEIQLLQEIYKLKYTLNQ